MSRFNMLNEEEKRAWLEGLRGRVAARGDSNQTLVDRLLEGKPGDAVRVLDLLADSEAGKRPSAIRRSSATKSIPKICTGKQGKKKRLRMSKSMSMCKGAYRENCSQAGGTAAGSSQQS